MPTTMTKSGKTVDDKKSLTRDPWQAMGFPSLNRMRQEFDDLFSKFFTEVPALWNAERTDLRWGFDVEDQPEAYVIKAEAPGFAPSDFNIELRGDQLVLQAKKSEKKSDKKGDKSEETFTATEFYRSMTLPPHVNAANIEAQYHQGVLQVTLPKTAEGKGRKIPVKG